MSEQLRICLVGATGLVGRTLIEQAVGRWDLRIVGVARREMPLPKGARMEMLIAPVDGWPDAIAASGASVMVCALGTTWAKAGKDEAAFRAVDQELVLAAARAGKAAGVNRMIAVSSAGADILSKNRYLRIKGETEEALGKIGFKRLDILRPGLLRGRREEMRPLEWLAMLLAPLIDPLLSGSWRRFHSIRVEVLAQAIFALAREKAGGRFVHDHDSLMRSIRRAGIDSLRG